MRAIEFLFEYRRDVTAQKMGDQLIATLANAPLSAVPENLNMFHDVAVMALHPEKYKTGTAIKYPTPEGPVPLNAETAPQILQRAKQGIINTILADIEAQDPTQNKEYSQWLVRSWINSGGQAKIEDMNRNDLLTAYTMGKRRKLIQPEHADINRFKTYADFENMLVKNYDVEQLIKDPKKEQESKGTAKTVYDGPNVRIIVPEDEPAACYYGRGTRWCTAATRGSNYFDQYNRQGPLYILLPKKPQFEGEKYQLHFPSGQFMDPNDDPVNVVELLGDRFPDTLEFFKENEPDIADIVEFAPDELLEGIGKLISQYAEELAWDEISDWQANDEYFHNWQVEQAEEKGYVDDDGEVDWDKVYDDDEIGDYTKFNDEAYRLSKDLSNIYGLRGRDIREFAGEYQREQDEPVTIKNMDDLYGWIIDKEAGAEYIAEKVAKNIYVRKNMGGQGNVLGKVGDWTVGLVRR